MLVLISPAKSLNFDRHLPDGVAPSVPRSHIEALALINRLKRLKPKAIASLMELSPALAELNYDRYQSFNQDSEHRLAKPAALAFDGDVYDGLDAKSFDQKIWLVAASQLRTLSGLYGLLKPTDLIQAHRLEMGTALATPAGKTLYAYWGDRITHWVNEDAQAAGASYILNLASNEYFKSVKPRLLSVPVIDCEFLDEKSGQYKTISFFAKRARGLMARFVLEGQLKEPSQLQGFKAEGYRFVSSEQKLKSDRLSLCFHRSEEARLSIQASG